MTSTPQISDAEWKVMEAVWLRHPATVREVFERLEEETGWAYSTVKTMLTRLAEKGVLEVEVRGHARWFSPLVSAREARGSALRALVERAFGGAFSSLVQHMVAEEEISGKDRAALEALIEEEFGTTDRPSSKGEA